MDSPDIIPRLLNDFQRDVPIVPRPFAEIGRALGTTEATILEQLSLLAQRGAVTRFGATCRPNTAGASTLAALSAPDWDVERIAEVVNAQDGINHSYLREHQWNLWFVATGPDRAHVTRVLSNIGQETGLKILDLPLVTPFHIDLGFDLNGGTKKIPEVARPVPTRAPDMVERAILQALSAGLPIIPNPFAPLAQKLKITEARLLTRIQTLLDDGFMTRFGIIVRHRAVGWRANAMVVWQLSPDKAAEIGPVLAQAPGVTLCYQRRAVPDLWPYTLYNMIHGRTRSEALEVLDNLRKTPELAKIPHEVLFSNRCFRQTGALIEVPPKQEAK